MTSLEQMIGSRGHSERIIIVHRVQDLEILEHRIPLVYFLIARTVSVFVTFPGTRLTRNHKH
jgi:hypothetical protein